MKSPSNSAPYFSAYPLKAIPCTEEVNAKLEPYLKALSEKKPKKSSKKNVFAMINPYTEQKIATPLKVFKPNVREIETNETDWFRNYE